MDWYHKFLRLAFRNPLDRDTIAICQISFEKINELYISNNLRNQTVSFKPDVKNKNPLQKQQKEWESLSEEKLSDVNIVIENLNIAQDFILGGIYWDFNNTLNLSLQISNRFSNKSFERLYMEMYDVVRHEIRHLYDDSRGKNISSPRQNKRVDMVENVRNASTFILSEAELVSYIDGMVLRAKKNHVPFSNLVVETVNKVFSIKAGDYKNNSIPMAISSQIQQIENHTIQAIIQKARSHYPNLQ